MSVTLTFEAMTLTFKAMTLKCHKCHVNLVMTDCDEFIKICPCIVEMGQKKHLKCLFDHIDLTVTHRGSTGPALHLLRTTARPIWLPLISLQ